MASSSVCHLLMAFLSVAVLVDGRVVHDAETKIVGGKEIEISKAPWQVFLRVGNYGCGGSIISPQWVLTAAHCTIGLTPNDIWMLVGTNSIKKKEPRYYVEEVINHENYTKKFLGVLNDISLLKSKTVLNLDGRPLRAVTLPELGATRPPVGTQVQVTGWGKTEKGDTSILRAVDIQINDFSKCRGYGLDESTQICAGLDGKDSCSGDSGGPLVKGDLLVGIVSYKNRFTACGKSPNIYMDVAAYRGWIKNHTGF